MRLVDSSIRLGTMWLFSDASSAYRCCCFRAAAARSTATSGGKETSPGSEILDAENRNAAGVRVR